MEHDLAILMREPVSVESVEALYQLPVETISVLVARLDDEVAAAITRLSNLRVLLHRGNSRITDLGLAHIAQLPQLEALDLEWSSQITGLGLQRLASLGRLKWLDLSFCGGIRALDIVHFRHRLPQCSIELNVSSPPRPPIARRIAEARERLGLERADVAEQLGVNASSYWDLEMHDDEAFVALSLRQLCMLADILRVSARELAGNELAAARPHRVLPSDIVAAINSRLVEGDTDVETLSEELGWDLSGVLQSPDQIWDDWCVEGLRDVCTRLRLDWRAFLPDRSETLATAERA